jgi:hypothetical protein
MMDRVRFFAAAARLRARRLGLVALVALVWGLSSLVATPSAHAATARVQPDPLSPLRVFIAVVPTTPAPLVVLHENERAHLDALTCERPASALDALRQAASSPTSPTSPGRH